MRRSTSIVLAACTLAFGAWACGTSDEVAPDGSSSGSSGSSSGSSGASSGTTSGGGSSGTSGDAGSPDGTGNDGGGNDAGPPFVPFGPRPGGGLAVGDAQSCAIAPTGKVKCWGSGATLGTGIGLPPFPGCNPSCGPIVATEIPGINNATEISVAIFDRRIFYRTASGDLFNYETSSRLVGGGVTGLAWTFATGSSVWVAGAAGRFLAVAGALTPAPSPLLTDPARYAAGYGRACAWFPTAPTKEVVCWNGDGVAVAQAGVSGARQVATTATSACAVLANGRARCWGGAYGAAPVDLGLDGVTQLAVHPTYEVPLPPEVELKTHSCAVLSTGVLVCWSPSASPTPTPFGGIAGAVEVTIGTRHACVRTGTGSAYCWGSNIYGQLGTGTASSGSAQPVLVLGF